MFTGIIENIGKIEKIYKNIFTISHNLPEKLEIGESIALNGMCATIIKILGQSFFVEIIGESLDRTDFGTAKIGDLINLERAIRIGDRNSGHFVLGHIDQSGKILSRKYVSDFELFRIEIFPENSNLIVFKGSIAVNGISLTVSNSAKNWFEVSLISHTLKNTNLFTKKRGDLVNLEFDILGKYVINLIKERAENKINEIME